MNPAQNDLTPHSASILQYCNSQRNPIAAKQRPRLSWQIKGAADGYLQTSYRIRVASCPEKLAEADVWCSGEILSDSSADIELPIALQSSRRYWWAVDVWDQAGTTYSSLGD